MTILPEFHDQLYAAAQRQARRRLPQPGIALPSRLGTFVATGLSAAVAILVAAVLLNAHAAPSTAPGSKTPSVARSRAELVQTLAALRTPQTAADRQSNRQFHGDPGYRQIDHPLVRTMALPSGSTLTLLPTTFQPTTAHRHGIGKRVTFTVNGPRVEGLALWLLLPGTAPVEASPSSVAALRAHGVNLFTYVHHQNTGVVIVPDGVTKVRLSEFRVTSHVHVDPNLIPAATTSVHNNVALFHIVAPTVITHGGPPGDGASGMYSTGADVHMTWFGPQGQVLKQTTMNNIAFNFIAQARH